MAHSFGISAINLSKLPTFEEKNKYILTCMSKTVENLLERWHQRHLNREKLKELENTRLENLKKYSLLNKKDQFAWLTVKTRFTT